MDGPWSFIGDLGGPTKFGRAAPIEGFPMKTTARRATRPLDANGLKARLLGAASALTWAVAASAAHAQAEIAEVIVTAQKRAESLQSVPLSVSAFSGEQMAQAGVASLQDLNGRAPGLTFGAYSVGQPEISIRGIGTKEDGAAASGSTVVSVDDVYVAVKTAQVFDIFDLERVEVLRGPQGTLYGKNSIGGSINFVTTKPTAQTRVRLSQTLGDYGRNDTAGLVSGGLGENVFGKFSFSHRSHDGYFRNILPTSPVYGRRQGESDTWAWRAQLRWTPNPDWEALLSLDGAQDEVGASNREAVGGLGPLHNCACASNPMAVNAALGGGTSPFDSLADEVGFTHRQVLGASLRLDRSWDWGSFTSISSYRWSRFNWYEDASGLPASKVFVDLSGASGNPGPVLAGLPASTGFTFDASNRALEVGRQFTQEFRLTSSDEGPATWVTGLFLSEERIGRQEGFRFPALGKADRLPSDMLSVQSAKSFSVAAYGQVGYRISDSLRVTGGLRYSNERKDITVEGRLLSGLPLLLQGFAPASADKSWGNLSGKIALDWTPAERIMFYASASTGFKTGGYTGSPSTARQGVTPYGPEKAINYELGAKTQFLERRLLVNATLFYTDYTDLQTTRFFQPVGRTFGEFITENAGKAVSKGFELEYTALPFQGLEIGGSYAYLDARFTRFTGLASTIGTGDFTGKRLRQAPRNTASAYVKYTLDLNDAGELSGKVDYRHQDLSYYDPDNNPITVIPAYGLWDLRLAWRSPQRRWEVAAWMRNATDERYRTHVYSQRDSRIAFATFGAPRTVGLTLNYDF